MGRDFLFDLQFDLQCDLHSLQSEAMTLKVLRAIHRDAKSSSLYSASSKVSACARQAVSFERAAQGADLAVLPLLRYYSLLNWMKSILHLTDLSYPASSAVLQHGISTRRTKRDTYCWPLEQVYVYKAGVLQSFYEMDKRPKPGLPARIVVGDLLGSLPAMSSRLIAFYPHFQHCYPLQDGPPAPDVLVDRRIASSQKLTIPEWIAAYIEASEQGFNPRLRNGAGADSAVRLDGQAGVLFGTEDGGFTSADAFAEFGPTELGAAESGSPRFGPDGQLQIPRPNANHPWLRSVNGRPFLLDNSAFPDWMIHFSLLYTLSSLCRYNPQEWSDILHWNNETDSALVRAYLDLPPVTFDLTDFLPVTPQFH
ncbi:YaaC family protein [Alicyclobacillus tolerans]|uniref:YaaC family protein n=1 Tax=Alicyclobacillus tolerans TaxID=90970 RepID=UPI001F4156F5|nr:YaaC family protein [Alicyclobacillus tolerans]MCF8567801.1 YaaC family protein [Alicyclobacillus tolerans]